jgi:hypothetical protein
MPAGSWLASLEFEVAGRRPHAVLRPAGGKPVWIYRIAGAAMNAGFEISPQAAGARVRQTPAGRPQGAARGRR